MPTLSCPANDLNGLSIDGVVFNEISNAYLALKEHSSGDQTEELWVFLKVNNADLLQRANTTRQDREQQAVAEAQAQVKSMQEAHVLEKENLEAASKTALDELKESHTVAIAKVEDEALALCEKARLDAVALVDKANIEKNKASLEYEKRIQQLEEDLRVALMTPQAKKAQLDKEKSDLEAKLAQINAQRLALE